MVKFLRTCGELTEPVSGRHWDAAQLRREVGDRVARYRSRGFSPGDRVLLHFGNRLEFFSELLAVWQLRGCVIPIDNRLTIFEILNLTHAAVARFHVVDDATPSDVISALPPESLMNTSENSNTTGHKSYHEDPPGPDDDALILFTSGSTGEPKGVVHTHRSLRARWASLQQCLGLDAYERSLCLLPTHFGHGLICNCLFPWLSGCHLFIAPPFSPALLMTLDVLIDEHRINFLSSVPSMWKLTLKSAPSPRKKTLRRIHVGSAPLSCGVWEQVQQWAQINEVLNVYGITETASWVAGTSSDNVTPQSDLIGDPWGSVIKVFKTPGGPSPLHTSVECAPGEVGMVWLQTPSMMRGYFELPRLSHSTGSDGWFRTGDTGWLDDRGRLFLKGRERDEINKGGAKVYPTDIDEVVERFPSVVDVCTFAYRGRLLRRECRHSGSAGRHELADGARPPELGHHPSGSFQTSRALVCARSDIPKRPRQNRPPVGDAGM